jgi:nucleotide-binding universal stress UspA family protein
MADAVVCGIDGSRESVTAAEVGVWLAEAVGSSAIFVNAVEEATVSPAGQSPEREREAKAALDAAHRRLADAASGRARSAECRVVSGTPSDALVAVADETHARAVCVGSRGRGPLRAALLGSTSRSVVRESPCPVLVVPRAAAARGAGGASIVCGLDGSPESENALRVAARLRRILDLRLVLVHVEALGAFVPAAPGAAPPPLDPREDIERRRRAAAAVISRVADRADVAIDAEERVEAGEPSHVIDAVAEEEDAAMIVVGTHARGALEGAARGSVSSRLAASASRPVVLVRADNLRPFG